MDQNVTPKSKKLHFEIDSETGTLSYESTKKYFSRFGIALFVFFAVNFVATYALYDVVMLFYPVYSQYDIVVSVLDYLISFIPNYCIALPIFLLMTKKLPTVELIKTKMKGGHIFIGFCICIALMLAGNYVSTILMMILQTIKGEAIANPVETMTAANAWWINLIFVAIIVPILEELLFRKVICKHLLPLGEGWAIILSGVIFGLAHGNFYQFFYAFLLGVFFAFIYNVIGRKL